MTGPQNYTIEPFHVMDSTFSYSLVVNCAPDSQYALLTYSIEVNEVIKAVVTQNVTLIEKNECNDFSSKQLIP